MMEAFVFEILPAFWARLCALAEQSAGYAFLRRLYRALRRLFQESLLSGLLAERPVPRACLRLDGLPVSAGRRLQKAGARLRLDTLLSTRRWQGLDFSSLCGAMLFFMFLCPARLWDNRIALVFALLLAGLLVVLFAAGRREPLPLRAVGLSFLLFMLVSVNGVVSARNLSEALRVFAFYVTSCLFALVLAAALSDRRKLKRLLAFLYLAVICTAAVAVWQRLTGVAVNPSQTDLAANAGMPGRVYSTLENPNNYAEFLVLLLPLSLAYTTMLDSRRVRLTATLLLTLPLAALLMTYSRSGWISFALAALVMLFFCQKRMLPLLLLLVLLALPLLPATVFRRILTIGSVKDSSNLYRVYIWQGTLRMLRQFGLTGVGFGPENFHPVYTLFCSGHAQEAQHAHMLYLELWAEIGLAGLICFLVFHFGLIRRAVLRIKHADSGLRMTLIASAASLTGISFAAAVEHVWFYPRDMFCYFILVGITLAAVNISKKESNTNS